MRALIRIASDGMAAWHGFWLSPQDPFPLCVMRLLVGGMLFYTHLIWSFDLHGFFGAAGWNNAGILATLQQDTLSWSLWWYVPKGFETHFHVTCLGVLLLFWMGCATRVTSVLAWAITVSYAHRSMLANFGLDQINAMLAFYLMLAPCGARLSIDSWWRSRRNMLRPPPSSAANLARRLIQVHICVIYFWAGLSKLQGSAWWTGEAIWQMIANHEYQSLDLTWLASYPTLLQLATHAVILFEISFPFFVFQRRLRPMAMIAGTALHLGIGAFFGMWTFGLIMIFGYVSFLDSTTIRLAASKIRSLFGSQPNRQEKVEREVAEIAAATHERLPQAAQEVSSENASPPAKDPLPNVVAPPPTTPVADTAAIETPADTVKFTSHTPTQDSSSYTGRRRYVADKLFYVARSQSQRANVRAYFKRHRMPCCVLRGAAELIERTVNLRKATVVLRAKDFSLPELQFWCDELVESNPDGQFRVFILPNTKQANSTAGLQIPPRIHLFRLSATTTLRRIRKLYLNQHWESPGDDEQENTSTKKQSPKIIRAAGLMILLLAVIFSAGCGASKDAPKVQLERARMMLDRGQLHEAVQTFTAALKVANGTADDYYDRGVAYEQLKQLDQAVADYTEALRLNASHAQALNNRAVVLAQLGRVGEALADLSRAIEINPQDSLAWSNRGLAQHESGNFEAAIADYTQALELGTEPRLHFQRGNVYVDAGQTEQAIDDFTAALTQDPSYVRAHLNRANALLQSGRLDEAVQDLQAAGEMDRELSMAGSIQQLEQQVRAERWQETAVAGLQDWLKTEGYEIRSTTSDPMSAYVLSRQIADEEQSVTTCILASTGPRGAPIIDAALTQKLMEYDGSVALLVIDKQELIRSKSAPTPERPTWLKDWRFEWRPLVSDFLPSQVEVLLGPPAD